VKKTVAAMHDKAKAKAATVADTTKPAKTTVHALKHSDSKHDTTVKAGAMGPK